MGAAHVSLLPHFCSTIRSTLRSTLRSCVFGTRMLREWTGPGPVRTAACVRLALPLAKGNFRPPIDPKWEAFATPSDQKTVLSAAAKPLITLKKAPDDSGALCFWKGGTIRPSFASILCTNLVHIAKVVPYPVWILLYYRDNKLML